MLQNPGDFSPVLFDIGAFIIICAICVFFTDGEHSLLKGYWLKPSNLFLFGYLVVNFQYILDYRLGIKTDLSIYILNSQILNICFVLGIVGLLAFVIGYTYKKGNTQDLTTAEIVTSRYRVPKFFILLQVVLFILFITSINVRDFLSGSVFADKTGRTSYEGLLNICNILVVAAVSLSYSNNAKLKDYLLCYPKVSLIIIIVYMILRMFSGDRGPFIYTALVLLYGYLYSTRKKWSLFFVVGTLTLASLFVILIGIARLSDLNASFFQRIQDAMIVYNTGGKFSNIGESSVFGLTEELGFSFVVNQVDVQAIAVNNESFHFGTYQIISLLNSIPFMPSFLANTMNIATVDLSSSGFANYHYFGGAEHTWSIGTTCLGDFYLDFGVFGVFFGFLIVGLFFRYLDEVLFVKPKDNISLFILFVILFFASQSIYIPRSVFLLNLQKVLLGGIVIFIYNKVLNVKR